MLKILLHQLSHHVIGSMHNDFVSFANVVSHSLLLRIGVFMLENEIDLLEEVAFNGSNDFKQAVASIKKFVVEARTTANNTGSPKLPTLAECQAHVQSELWSRPGAISTITTTECVYNFICRQLRAGA
jgi:hypothetical protein